MLIELIVVFFTLLVVWFVIDNWKSRDLPPGPQRIPIIGNLHQFAKFKKTENAPYKILQNMAKEYGSMYSLQIGNTYQVVIDDPQMMKHVLMSEHWADRYQDKWILARSFGKPYGLLFSNGESWKELRRFSLRTLRDFNFGRQGHEATMNEELTDLISHLNQTIEKGNNIVNMDQFFTISVLNILWSMIAGERFSYDDPKLNEFVNGISSIMRIMGYGNNLMMAFPFLTPLTMNFTTNGKLRKRILGEIYDSFKKILKERRQAGYYKDDQRDYIDVFLREIDNHKSDNPKFNYYTDDEFAVCALDLFAAGSETTSNTLEFGILHMLLNPDIQAKVQEEIDRVVGRDRFPNANDKPNMVFTEATILEIQRLANVVPILQRAPIRDTTLGPYKIPKGTLGCINLYSAHTNPSVWEDPLKFNPSRFIDENGAICNTQNLLVFGQGKRMCLGEVLARSTLFCYFASFLQRYTFSKSPSHPTPTTEPRLGMTLAPRAYHVLIKHRY